MTTSKAAATLVLLAMCWTFAQAQSEQLSDQQLFDRVARHDALPGSEVYAPLASRLHQLSREQIHDVLLAYKSYVDANFNGDDRKRAYRTMVRLFPIQDALLFAEPELWVNGTFADRFRYLNIFTFSEVNRTAEERRYLCGRILAYHREIEDDSALSSDIRYELHQILLNILSTNGDEGLDVVLQIYPHPAAAARILGAIGTERAIDTLCRVYYEIPTMDNQLGVAKTLANRWDRVKNEAVQRDILRMLDTALNSGEARYRKMAIDVVNVLDDERFLPKLRQMAASDPSRGISSDDATGTNSTNYDIREFATKVIREFENRRRPGYKQHKFIYDRLDYAQRQVDSATSNINAGVRVEHNQRALRRAQDDLAEWTRALEEALAKP